MSDGLLLSVVVVIVSDTTDRDPDVSHLRSCLEALSAQANPPRMEIIVPYHPPVKGMEDLEREFQQVLYVPVCELRSHTGRVGGREHHDELRARGLAFARGEIVALLEDHGIPDPFWATNIVQAHNNGFAAVGGAIENGIDRTQNWAVYFCDFLRYQNPLPAGESVYASDANMSFKREALDKIRPVWQDIFHETTVNAEFMRRGQKLGLSPSIVVHQHRQNLRLGAAIKERFIWGRSYGGTRVEFERGSRRLILSILAPALPALILLRMCITILQKRRSVGAFLRAFPLTVLLAVSWSLGEMVGYITGIPNTSVVPRLSKPISRGSQAARLNVPKS